MNPASIIVNCTASSTSSPAYNLLCHNPSVHDNDSFLSIFLANQKGRRLEVFQRSSHLQTQSPPPHAPTTGSHHLRITLSLPEDVSLFQSLSQMFRSLLSSFFVISLTLFNCDLFSRKCLTSSLIFPAIFLIAVVSAIL